MQFGLFEREQPMSNRTKLSFFERSGLAALSDLNSPEFRHLFSILENEQDAFLEKESEFRSKKYKWPRDPLHNFSRVWEYPYVYYHLSAYLKALPQTPKPLVADVGSGVTFFPFALSKLGYQVICTDIDPICKKDLSLARKCVLPSQGNVDFRLIEDRDIPFKDSECDALYCISVLEHIPDIEKTLSEIARVLKPGGVCLITCDINLRPKDELQLDNTQYERLTSLIEHSFEQLWPDRTIHPANILTTKNSPYPLKVPDRGLAMMGWQIIKQKLLKPLLGQKSGNIQFGLADVAVLALALKKRT